VTLASRHAGVFDTFGDPDSTAVIETHGDWVDQHWLAGDQIHLETFGNLHLADRLGWLQSGPWGRGLIVGDCRFLVWILLGARQAQGKEQGGKGIHGGLSGMRLGGWLLWWHYTGKWHRVQQAWGQGRPARACREIRQSGAGVSMPWLQFFDWLARTAMAR
jgi:hypothetical protein